MPIEGWPPGPDAIPKAANVQAFCERILASGDLATKLAPPVAADGGPLVDAPSGPVLVDRPTRGPGLRMQGGSDRLPRPGRLRDASERATCLARFAHHELQAVEYFAWALLRWPDLPTALRRGWLAALADEQRHCRLYLDRLAAHGGRFDGDDHSDYFWRQADAIAASPAGPRAFLAAMGLTLEQANLDFTLTYRDGFADAGDVESAAVCQRVHDEEIGHVALAARWLVQLDALPDDTDSDVEDRADCDVENRVHSDVDTEAEDRVDDGARDLSAYLSAVPFPLGASRAKGRRFEVAPRRKAGLSEPLIEHVRVARSSQERPNRPPADRP